MSGVVLEGEQAPRKLQELARLQMIYRLYCDILHDMAVCEEEGWDKTEYIRQLQKALDFFGNREAHE